MTDLQEKAMRMALEALDTLLAENNVANREYAAKASQALRQALAQPEQKPVAFPDAPTTIYLQVCDDMDCGESFYDHTDVSWCDDQINDSDIKYIRADIAPPKREWKGLTIDDKHFLLANAWNKEQAFDGFMDAINKFLKEKNR